MNAPTTPRKTRLRLTPAAKAALYSQLQDALADAAKMLRESYPKCVAFWMGILEDPNETVSNKMQAADRLAAYSVGTPARMESVKGQQQSDVIKGLQERLSASDVKLLPAAPTQ